ncbi:MAG: hypothetical protein MMC33_009732 [Icmadophila ericetorum]|nr:hypothetical protein [Icmadophila ericetorum]
MVGPTITRPSTYCPTSVVPNGTCPAGTQTVFANGGSALDVEVPGGQQVYIAPSGLLTYTRAHSSSYPPGSQFGGFGALDGEYVITSPAGQGWLACPSSQVAQAYQIYADRAGHPDGCTDITLLLHSYTGPFAAWQYT